MKKEISDMSWIFSLQPTDNRCSKSHIFVSNIIKTSDGNSAAKKINISNLTAYRKFKAKQKLNLLL